MRAADIPVQIPTPFASEAAPAFVTTPIPEFTASPGHADMQQGFPPQNFQPPGSGGTAPFGAEMNGILNMATAWSRWSGAGAPVPYDAAFAAALTPTPGYPAGAVLMSANGLGWWLSSIDNNMTDPDSGGAGWFLVTINAVYAGDPNGHVAGHAAASDPSAATVSPTLCWDALNGAFWVCTTTGVAASAVWTPLTVLIPVDPAVTGTNYPYTTADSGKLRVRSNSGIAMADPLPAAGTVGNGWNVYVFNGDASAALTITAPGSTELNGVVAGSLTLAHGASTAITADATGNFWTTVQQIPQVFSSQYIYVNASGTHAPGSYDIDTSAGPITFTLEAGGGDGDNYTLRDVAGALGANPCAVGPNGRTCDVSALDVPWAELALTLKTGNWSLV